MLGKLFQSYQIVFWRKFIRKSAAGIGMLW